ncbi:MAG: PIN domain-containing protein [Caulobacter sp.]|nr:PIN domain-containing protein [Caulobacter sp.]
MIVLDTNVVSELMKPRPDERVRDWLTQLGDEPLATTAVSIAEIEFGLRRLPPGRRRDDLQSRFETFAAALAVLPLDDLAAREAGRFRAMRAAAGQSCPPSDMMIAGIAAVAAAALATRNIRDFEGLAVRIVDPWLGG